MEIAAPQAELQLDLMTNHHHVDATMMRPTPVTLPALSERLSLTPTPPVRHSASAVLFGRGATTRVPRARLLPKKLETCIEDTKGPCNGSSKCFQFHLLLAVALADCTCIMTLSTIRSGLIKIYCTAEPNA